MTTQTGWACVSGGFLVFPLRSVVRKVSDTAARMVETENDGRGGVLCFDLARMFAYLRNTPKKPPATQARDEREPRKWDA